MNGLMEHIQNADSYLMNFSFSQREKEENPVYTFPYIKFLSRSIPPIVFSAIWVIAGLKIF